MSRPARKRMIEAPPGFHGCTQCGVVKPVAEFYPAPLGPDGHSSMCKRCTIGRKAKARAALLGKPDLTIAARFWAKVEKREPEECWEWRGARTKRGYGVVYYQGRDEMAHRVSVFLDGRGMPEWPMVVDHMCKNIGCVNPRHLRVVTQTENICDLAPAGVSFKNKAKVECVNGHPFDGDNMAVVLLGTRKQRARVCLTCYPSYRNNPNRID